MAKESPMPEIKDIIEGLNKSFTDFKSVNDQRLAEIEKKGFASAALETKLSKIEADLQTKEAEQKKALENIQAALKRVNGSLDTKASNGLTPDQMEHKSQFFGWMRGKGNESILRDLEKKTLQVADDTQGGFYVPADVTGRIISKLFDTSPMRQFASVANIGTGALEGPTDLGEAEGGYVGESGDRSADSGNPTLGTWRIPVHELWTMPKATQNVIDDSVYDLESWLVKKIGEKFARIENREFVLGTTKIRGFLSYDIVTTLSGDDYTAKKKIQYSKTGVSGGFAATPNGGDILIDMQQSLKESYRAKAAWAMNRFTVGEVRKLKDSQGRYLWAPGIQVGAPNTLLNLPIAEFNDMPNVAANSLSLALADWTEAYQIVDRQGIRLMRDNITTKGFVKFYTTKRTGGDLLNFEAIKLLKFAA
jgi:HK97 family phage major capsid protein